MTKTYKLILGDNEDKILEEDEVLEEILEYLNTIVEKLDTIQLVLENIEDFDGIRF